MLHERLLALVPAAFENLLLYRHACLFPDFIIGWKSITAGNRQPPVQRYPTHDLGIHKVVGAVPHFPDPGILDGPVFNHVIT